MPKKSSIIKKTKSGPLNFSGLFPCLEQIAIYIYLIIFIVLLDQFSKYLAIKNLADASSKDIIKNVFRLTYHENAGAAWGILSEHRWVFMSISVLAIVLLSIYLYIIRKQNEPLLKIALSFFIGGGIGNMIDRIVLGYVIDFFDFCLIDFPIFNVADSFVTIGAILMIIYLILDSIKDYKNKKAEKE